MPDEYLVTRVLEALASDDRVSQLDIDVQVRDKQVILSGTVATQDRRRAIHHVTQEVLPDHEIIDELQVIGLSGAPSIDSRDAICVAAVGDIHFGLDSDGQLRDCLENIEVEADLLLLAGDLTRHGEPDEARILAKDLSDCPIPVIAVLGNHDHNSDAEDELSRILEDSGVVILEGNSTTLNIRGTTVGIAGTKGFGGGFVGASGSEFGERIQRNYIAHSRMLAEKLRNNLQDLTTDIRIALTHFSPVADTLRGEPLEIYPWLGSYFLAEAIDEGQCHIAFHGHAHAGTECGATAGGVPVRNVAQPVIRQPYKVYPLETTNSRSSGGVLRPSVVSTVEG